MRDKLLTPAVLLAGLSISAYLVASVYLSAYLGVFGASLSWFNPSLVQMLLMSWPGLVFAAAVALGANILPIYAIDDPKVWTFQNFAAAICLLAIPVIGGFNEALIDGRLTFRSVWLSIAVLVMDVLWFYMLSRPQRRSRARREREAGLNSAFATRLNTPVITAAIFAVGFGTYNAGRFHAALNYPRTNASQAITTSEEVRTWMIFTDGSSALTASRLSPMTGVPKFRLQSPALADPIEY